MEETHRCSQLHSVLGLADQSSFPQSSHGDLLFQVQPASFGSVEDLLESDVLQRFLDPHHVDFRQSLIQGVGASFESRVLFGPSLSLAFVSES